MRVNARLLVRNTVANAAGGVVIALLAVVMTPFFLTRLGPSEYGVWLLATTLTFATGYLALADLGLQQTAVRAIADAKGRGDARIVNEVVSTLVAVFFVVGAVVGGVVALLATVLVGAFRIDPGLEQAATIAFTLAGLQLALDLPGAGLHALIEGAQRYASLRSIEVGSRCLWAAGAVIVVTAGGGVVAMAVVALAVSLVMLLVSVVLARRIEPGLVVRPKLANGSTFRTLVRQGSSMLVLRATYIVYRQMDRAIIGVLLGAAAVARYEVAYKIHAIAALVLSVAPSAVMPAAAHLGAGQDETRLRSMYLRGTKYALAFSLPVTLSALVYARALIVAWVGPAYADLTGATRLFLTYPVLVVVHAVGVTMLVGLNRTREVVVLSPLSVATNLVASLLLVPRVGIIGVVWGTVVGYAVIWVPYVQLMLRSFSVSLAQWAREAILPNLPGAAIQIGLGLATFRFVERLGSLWEVGLATALNGAASLGCFLFVVLGSAERAELLGGLVGRRRGATFGQPGTPTG